MSRLTLNESQYVVGDEESDTKVRQSNVNDLQSFQDVIRGSGNYDRPLRSIGEAYSYFRQEIEDWLNENPDVRSERASALETTLTEYLQLATVDLDEDEKPHFIFSVLNARAEPLKESDHVKNTVMYMANVVDDAPRATELWGTFDRNEWWRGNTSEGRYSRIHLDRFLNYWVIMQTRKEVNAESVSSEFNSHLDSTNSPIEEVAADIRKAGQVYWDLEEARTSGIEIFLRRVKTMEIGVAMPFLLWLYTSEDIPEGVRLRTTRAMESYLVRRMLCGVTSQGLNRLFVELLARVGADSAKAADEIAIEFLSGQTVDNRIWPSDSMLIDNLVGVPMRGTVGRQIMVLEAIESYLRSAKTEGLGPGPFTREHIMPESWQRNWRLPEDKTGEDAETARNQAVKEIGNLTLVTGPLNASLSNAPWNEKAKTLERHTTLRLNWTLLNPTPPAWTEETIRKRSKELAQIATEVWPHANKL